MNCFCTIITSDFFFYAQAIYDSLKKFRPEVNFMVLVVDDNGSLLSYESIQIFNLEDIKSAYPDAFQTIKKYEDDPNSALRWALKPLFLKFLLTKQNMSKAILVDPDLYFYEDPFFLFEKLEISDVIITPHWRSINPKIDKSNFDNLFTGGIYNAGFFGCNTNSENILDWWLDVCAYKMVKKDGFYVDQAYLNLMPVYFTSQVEVIQHKGCNVSNWNTIECQRTLVKNKVLINNEYPVVFIHFANLTISNIANGEDKILIPFLETYKNALLIHNADFKFKDASLKFKEVKEKRFSIKKIFKKLLK
jgi:hypothetical protein